MISILEKISAYQLQELTLVDGTDSHYRLPPQKDHIYSKECEEFKSYYLSNKGTKFVCPTDQECKEFIAFTKKHGKKCKGANRMCVYKVCPWCDKNKVIHDKDGCTKVQEIKETYGTWRRHFMKLSKILEGHEWAIYRSYFQGIGFDLYAKHCPCFEVLNATTDDDIQLIKELKTVDARLLKLNMEKVRYVNNVNEALLIMSNGGNIFEYMRSDLKDISSDLQEIHENIQSTNNMITETNHNANKVKDSMENINNNIQLILQDIKDNPEKYKKLINKQ